MKSSRISSKDFLKSQSVVRKRRKKKLFRIYALVFIAVLLLIGLYFLSRLDSLLIKRVVVVGNSTVPSTDIERVANSLLDSSYFGIITKRNSFFYPKDDIRSTLLETFPRIESLALDTESFSLLNIRVKERSPYAKWCSAIECYFVDEYAYIYTKANDESTSTLAIMGLEEKIGTEPVGKTMMSEAMLKQLVAMTNELEKENLHVYEIEYRSKDEIVFKIENNGRILFNERRPLELSFSNLMTAIKSEVLTSGTSTFEYIDTRFGNKVFYKLRK